MAWMADPSGRTDAGQVYSICWTLGREIYAKRQNNYNTDYHYSNYYNIYFIFMYSLIKSERRDF